MTGVIRNTVKLDVLVKGSSLTPYGGEANDPYKIKPRAVLSDDHSKNVLDFYAPPSSKELPRPSAPSAGDPYPSLTGQELVGNGTVPVGWDYRFVGNWTYNEDTTDGGVIGNLRPLNDLHSFVMRISLDQLYDPAGPSDPNDPNYKGIKKIVFYDFPQAVGTYANPFDPNIYDGSAYVRYEFDVSQLGQGGVIFITNCCEAVPEPVTLILLGVGGLSLAGVGWRHYRRMAAARR